MIRVIISAVALSLFLVGPAHATSGNKGNSGGSVNNNNNNKVDNRVNNSVKNDVNNNLKNTNSNNVSNQNSVKNSNENKNLNNNNNDNDNRNNNDNSNKNSNNNRNNNDNRNDNNNHNQQAQGQKQGQAQDQNQNQTQSAISDAQSNSTAQVDTSNSVSVHGGETYISYREAASAAASVYTSECQDGASAQGMKVGGAFARTSTQCAYLRQAMAYLQTIIANVELINPQLDSYQLRIRRLIVEKEKEYKESEDSFMDEIIKGGPVKPRDQMIAEQRELALRRQVLNRQLEVLYAQYEDIEWLIIQQYPEYKEALEGFYSSVNQANVSIKRRGVTGFVAELAADIVWPIGLAKLLF